MRKGIRIEAFMIFLAWGMIFLHNIVPHNHLQENNTGCHELVHNESPAEDGCSGPLKFNPEPTDIQVCHISNFLYHQFSEDNFIHPSDGITVTTFFLQESNWHTGVGQSFIPEISSGSVSFRAPPSA